MTKVNFEKKNWNPLTDSEHRAKNFWRGNPLTQSEHRAKKSWRGSYLTNTFVVVFLYESIEEPIRIEHELFQRTGKLQQDDS